MIAISSRLANIGIKIVRTDESKQAKHMTRLAPNTSDKQPPGIYMINRKTIIILNRIEGG